jgi:hypothetical protein
MGNRRDKLSFLLADLEYPHHERHSVVLFKPLRYGVLEH